MTILTATAMSFTVSSRSGTLLFGLFAAGLIFFLYSFGAIHHLTVFKGDPSAFIAAGDHFVDAAQLLSPITVKSNSAGYDGEFYYRLALNPFTSKPTDFGITLDNPATRGARIGYPLLAWIVSLGHPVYLPWVLIGINLVGLALIALLAVVIVRSLGLSVWRALPLPLYPGFLLTLVRDTTEITATVFALAAVACVLYPASPIASRRHGGPLQVSVPSPAGRPSWRYWLAGGALSCAVVTRETTLFYLAGFGIVEAVRCLRYRRWAWSLIPLVIPAIVFGLWQSFVVWHWGASSYSGTSQNIGRPLQGFLEYVVREWREFRIPVGRPNSGKLYVYNLATAAFVAALIGLVGVVLTWWQSVPELAVSWALYAALVLCLTTAIWVQPFDYMRAATDLFVVSAILIAISRARWPSFALLAMVIPLWLATYWFLQTYDV